MYSSSGPKTIAELFQISTTTGGSVVSAERRPPKSSHGAATAGAPSRPGDGDRSNKQAGEQGNTTAPSLDTVPVRDIPLPEEEEVVMEEAAASKTETQQLGSATTNSGGGTGTGEDEFEVLDEYEEEERESSGKEEVVPAADFSGESSTVAASHPLVLQPQFILPHLGGPAYMVDPMPHHHHHHNTLNSSTVTGQPIPAAPYHQPFGYFTGDEPSTSHHMPQPPSTSLVPYQSQPYPSEAVGGKSGGSSSTSPPLASRAYVPHALHPTNDPPPPYRPYIPSKCDGQGSADSSHRQHHHRHHHDDDAGRNRRARSPHALPHPLEHYQRCLTSALTAEEEAMALDGAYRGHHHHASSSTKQQQQTSSYLLARVATPTAQSGSKEEDLDARIARLFDVASRGSRRPSIGSPPPPPPPLPLSQRIICTHQPSDGRPTQPNSGYFARSSSSIAVPPNYYSRGGPTSTTKYGHANFGYHRRAAGFNTHGRGGGGGYSNYRGAAYRYPGQVRPPAPHQRAFHHRQQQHRAAVDNDNTEASSRTTDVQHRRRESSREEEGDIYSMLGV